MTNHNASGLGSSSVPCTREWDSRVKGVGMLVVSLSGANFGFWSHLGCYGENVIMCSPYVAVKVSFMVSREENKKYLYNMF